MADFRYGPVEFYLVGLAGESPDAATLGALTDLLESGLVRLLDFVVISKNADGDVSITDIEDEGSDLGLNDVELHAVGIAGDEDIEEFAELVEPGSSAALVALELTFQRDLAAKLAASGSVVLANERVPAPVVNALIDLIEAEEEEGE